MHHPKVKAWAGHTECGLGVLILPRAMRALRKMTRNAGSLMTAGILLGRYSDDENAAIVTEACRPPRDTVRKPREVVRGVAGLDALCDKRWRAPVRTYYVGDWHYAPTDTMLWPCEDDMNSLIDISRSEESRCAEPLMVSMGLTKMRVHIWHGQLEEFHRCGRKDL